MAPPTASVHVLSWPAGSAENRLFCCEKWPYSRALVHAWHRGACLGPVHAGSKQGDQAGCSGSGLSRHARAAATISACAAGRGYYLGMHGPRLISAGLRHGYYLGMRGPRLLSRHAPRAAATMSACKGRGLSRQGCATATISACAGRGYYLGAPRLLSRHACAGNACVCSRRLSTARRDAARPAGHRCSGRPGDGRSKQC